MKPYLSVLCLLAICDLTDIIDGIPRDQAWAATEAITKRRAFALSYRRYWRKRI
jgi:hypothetical protein